jgi:hypothetical protein
VSAEEVEVGVDSLPQSIEPVDATLISSPSFLLTASVQCGGDGNRADARAKDDGHGDHMTSTAT